MAKEREVQVRNKKTGKTRTADDRLAKQARRAIAEGKDSFRGGFLGLGKKYRVVDGKQSTPKQSPSARAATKAAAKAKAKSSAPTSSARPKGRSAKSGASFGGAKARAANSAKSGVSFGGAKARTTAAKPSSKSGSKTYSGRGSGPQGPVADVDRAKATVNVRRSRGEKAYKFGSSDDARLSRRAVKQLEEEGGLGPMGKKPVSRREARTGRK